MDKVFNTEFEVGLRILLCLYSTNTNGISVDRITAYDFLSVYGRDFGLADSNLYGENQYSFSELSTRREICSKALRTLALDGLVSVNRSSRGFLYRLNSNGRKYAESLQSDFAKSYIDIVKNTHQRYAKRPDEKLMNDINTMAIQALRRQYEVTSSL